MSAEEEARGDGEAHPESGKKCRGNERRAEGLLAVGASFGGVFSGFIEIFDDVLIDEKVGAAEAGELDTFAVVPFDDAAEDFAIGEDDRDRSAGLHLFDEIEAFGVGLVGGRGLFALGGCACATGMVWVVLLSRGSSAIGRRFFDISEGGAKQFTIHWHNSFKRCRSISAH